LIDDIFKITEAMMAGKRITVALTIDDCKVTIEGPEDFVKGEVQRLTSAIAGKNAMPLQSGAVSVARTEREFIGEKQPKSQSEKVAVLGFYLAEHGHSEFTEADIRKAYIRAGVRPPKVVSQALRDAKNKLDLIESGMKRGTYRVSPHGDRTVRFDLPRVHS
jgi:hypothetical protein